MTTLHVILRSYIMYRKPRTYGIWLQHFICEKILILVEIFSLKIKPDYCCWVKHFSFLKVRTNTNSYKDIIGRIVFKSTVY